MLESRNRCVRTGRADVACAKAPGRRRGSRPGLGYAQGPAQAQPGTCPAPTERPADGPDADDDSRAEAVQQPRGDGGRRTSRAGQHRARSAERRRFTASASAGKAGRRRSVRNPNQGFVSPRATGPGGSSRSLKQGRLSCAYANRRVSAEEQHQLPRTVDAKPGFAAGSRRGAGCRRRLASSGRDGICGRRRPERRLGPASAGRLDGRAVMSRRMVLSGSVSH